MGGIGSGAKRTTRIGNVEDVPALDIRLLRRLGVVTPGTCMIDTVYWRIGGLRACSVRLRVDLSDIERGGDMMVTGDMPGGAIKQRIAIDAVPAHMGGHRCYYICPTTAERCEVLYYADGRFASRKAHRLSYAVQSMTALSAARLRDGKLRRRLKGEGGMPRARGRNRLTVVRRAEEAEMIAIALYRDRLRGAADLSGTRRRPSNKRR
ncbi:hypothetical protein [Novosphingobium sp. FSW06-99]|uniref:hypothetical protein n=1 Tax=Novosphingobium sp. FSW06-99 TaxID=1739113 RepID=UPI000B23991C|nr:hypothetical protein [Novosphingobium sp. FSW06-99]